MYNLLVTSNEGAWNLPAYEYDASRFLEHTADILKTRYRNLTAATIEELKSFPALFSYEGNEGLARIGYLRRITERGRGILVEYEFDEAMEPFRVSELLPFQVQLGIGTWEMSRTHWAIKDVDLLSVLSSAGLVESALVESEGQFGRVEEMRFKVALTFAGENRDYVAAVAAHLKRRLGRGRVFYDRDFTAQLARPNLDTLLQRIYLRNSDLIVVFLSADYERKEWCGLEWRAVRQIIKNRNDHAVMFMRFDGADVSGMLAIDGYVDLEAHSPLEASLMIMERVRLNDLPQGTS